MKSLGIGSVLVATTLWGSTGTLQSLLPESREPLAVGALRLLFGALFLFLLAVLNQPCRQNIRKLPWFLIIFAGISIGFYNLFFFWAVTKAGVGVGTAITIGSAPVWVTVYEILVTKQWPRRMRALGQFISIGGVGLLATTGAGGRWNRKWYSPLTGGRCLLCSLFFSNQQNGRPRTVNPYCRKHLLHSRTNYQPCLFLCANNMAVRIV